MPSNVVPIANDWLQATGGAQPHALIYAHGFVWVGCETNPGILIRIDPANPQGYQQITFPFDGAHAWIMDIIYIPWRDKVYCLFGFPFQIGPGIATVVEVDPVSMAWHEVISDSTYNPEQGSFCVDGQYMYIVSRLNSNIYRYNLFNWSRQGNLALAFDTGAHCVRTDGAKIFVTNSAISPSNNICRIDTATFTVEQYQSILVSDSSLTDDMALTASYVWCGAETSGNITRFNKADLSYITIATGANGACYCVYFDGTWIWAAFQGTWDGSHGCLLRMDPNSLAQQWFGFSTTTQVSSNEIWSDNPSYPPALPTAGQSHKIWVSYFLTPAIVSQHTLSTPVVGTLTPAAAQMFVTGGQPQVIVPGPATAHLVITGGQPTLIGSALYILTPPSANLHITGGHPTLVGSSLIRLTPTPASLQIAGGQPSLVVSSSNPITIVIGDVEDYVFGW